MDEEDLGRRLAQVPIPESEAARERTVHAAVATGGATPDGDGRARRRFVRIVALSVLGAAILVAVGLLRGSSDDPKADSFEAYAALAAEQPAGLQYLKWTSEYEFDRPDFYSQGARYPDKIKDSLSIEQWADETERYETSSHQYWDGQPKTTELESLYDRRLDVYCYTDPRGGGGRECTNLPFELGPDVSDLPTDPAALRRELITQIESRDDDDETPKCEVGDAFGAPLPDSLGTTADRQEVLISLRVTAGLKLTPSGYSYNPPVNEKLFTWTTSLLASPMSSPELRSALFEVLANLHGARLAPDGEDALGREASIIEYSTPPPDPATDRVALDQVYVDPSTSEVLEQRTTVLEPKAGTGEMTTIGTYDRLIEDREVVDELPPQAAPLVATLERQTAGC